MPAIGTPVAVPELNLMPEQQGGVQLSEDMQQTLSLLTAFFLNKRVVLKASASGMLYVINPPMKDVFHVTATGAAFTYQGDNIPCSEVLVIAHADNSGRVWVRVNGTATVNNAIPLEAGDALSVSIINLNMLNLLIATNGEKAIIAYSL
jgi:hypothetical protein